MTWRALSISPSEEDDAAAAAQAVVDAAANAEKTIALNERADAAAAYFKSAPGAIPEGAEVGPGHSIPFQVNLTVSS